MGFKIERQTDRQDGCIPTCAVSVLKHIGVSAPPTEQLLVDLMAKSQAASGLKKLAEALGSSCSVVIEEKLRKDALTNRLTALTGEGHLVLVALSGSPAHCVVVVGVKDGNVLAQDPWEANAWDLPARDFWEKAAGDLATLRPT